ncbi:MAG: hypothetical protein ACJ0BL_00915 [Dehalococcoidia bacterium]
MKKFLLKNKYKVALLVVSIIVLVSVGGTFLFNKGDDSSVSVIQEDEQLYVVSNDDLVRSVSSSGHLSYGQAKDVHFQFAGTIQSINFPGTDPVHIRKGELIAEIDTNTIARLNLIHKQAVEETSLAEEKLRDFTTLEQERLQKDNAQNVATAEQQRDSARKSLDELLDQQKIKDGAAYTMFVKEKELSDSQNLLEDLKSPYPSGIAQLDQLALNAKLFLDSVKDFTDLNLEYESASSSLYSLILQMDLSNRLLDDEISDLEKIVEDNEKNYGDYLQRWFGVKNSSLLSLSPKAIYQDWGIDPEILFDKNSRLSDTRSFVSNYNPSSLSETPWDDATVLAWLTFYPGAIVGKCPDPQRISPGAFCVDKELNDAWDILTDSRKNLRNRITQGERDTENLQDQIRRSKNALQRAEDNLNEFNGTLEDSPSVFKSDYEIAYRSYESALSAAQQARDQLGTSIAAQQKEVATKRHALATATEDYEDVLEGPSQFEINAAEVSLTVSESELSFSIDEYNKSLTPDPIILAVLESALASKKLDERKAFNNFSNPHIYSPVDGILLRSEHHGSLRAGTNFIEGQMAAQVAPYDSIVFQGEVGESEISNIALGMETLVLIDVDDDKKKLNGILDTISPMSNKASGTVRYKISVNINDLPDNLQTEGFSAVAKIVLERQSDVIKVPLDAIKQRGDETYVRIYKDDRITDRKVDLGINDDFWVGVTSGLSSGESIVITSKRTSSERFELDMED